jgi:lambda family phage portal protein
MNWIDRIVAQVSPEAGLRRANARQLLDQSSSGSRSYAAAGRGRRNAGRLAPATSANSEVGAALGLLRDRARAFCRDTPAGARILDLFPAHVVGTGIGVTADTGSDADDKRFQAAFDEWASACDIEGVMNFGAMQALTVRSMIEGGEAVIRMVTDPSVGPNKVNMRLLGIEGDLIDTSREAIQASDNARLGVELGEFGQRKGLWLWEEHPGERRKLLPQYKSNLIKWQDLCHVYRVLRFGQVRGISWFAPVFMTGRDLQDLVEAAIVQARTQASFAGFIHRPPQQTSPVLGETAAATGEKVSRIEPGMIADIGEAEITFANPSSQSAFAEVYIAGMQAMAAGVGMTYDQLTGDLRQANYSSLRAGKIEHRRLVEQIQSHIVMPRLVLPVVKAFTDRAMMQRILPRRSHNYNVSLIPPANEPIDPLKDMEADILAVRSGRMTPQEFMSSWGLDWRKAIKDFQAFFAATDGAGFSFLDIDPRQTAASKGASNNDPAKNP